MFSKILKILSPMQWLEIGFIVIILFSVFNFTATFSDVVKNKFGMETKASLKEQTIKQEGVIKTIEDANKSLVDTIKKNEQTAKIDKDTVINKFKEDNKVEEKISTVIIKKDKVISEVKKKYADQPITLDSEKQMEKEVSTLQITSLWIIYCSESDNNEQCKKDVV